MLFPILITGLLGYATWRIIRRENGCPLCTPKRFCHSCGLKAMRRVMKNGNG